MSPEQLEIQFKMHHCFLLNLPVLFLCLPLLSLFSPARNVFLLNKYSLKLSHELLPFIWYGSRARLGGSSRTTFFEDSSQTM